MKPICWIFSRLAAWPSSFRAPASKEEFVADLKTQSAVIHQLLVIGEAVKRLSPEFRAAHPEIPWKLIAGTRDKLIHFYEGVDVGEIWQMITMDLPPLLRWVEPFLPLSP